MEKSILIIDDEEEIGRVIKEFFEERKFTVSIATRAKEGCEYVRRQKPSLVLLDMRLPDQDGIRCLREIKIAAPHTTVMMLTALHDEKLARSALEHGALDYITKPFDLEELHDRWVAPLFS